MFNKYIFKTTLSGTIVNIIEIYTNKAYCVTIYIYETFSYNTNNKANNKWRIEYTRKNFQFSFKVVKSDARMKLF